MPADPLTELFDNWWANRVPPSMREALLSVMSEVEVKLLYGTIANDGVQWYMGRMAETLEQSLNQPISLTRDDDQLS